MPLIESAISANQPRSLSARKGPLSAAAVLPFALAKGGCGALVLVFEQDGAAITSEQLDAVATLAGFTSVAFQNAALQEAQRNFFAHVTEMLVAALDAQLDRGDKRAGHPDRIAAVANSVGRELKLDQDSLQRLHFGSLLHDIGYLKIDRALHYDPAQCKHHPALGHRMLSRIRLWEDVAPIVMHHHDWFDGSGYTENRVGSDIPREARIIAVIDTFDKLTHEEMERPPISVAEALAHLERGKGRQFDPEVVDALSAIVERGELVA
jgi:HD-GYP domain-containing protein (c-di-GMP phosphodiesterase class II)